MSLNQEKNTPTNLNKLTGVYNGMIMALEMAYRYLRKKYWFNKVRSIIDSRPGQKDVPKLYFWKNGNFGDELNDDLMRYFQLEYAHSRPLGANTTCIGSNLQQFVNVFPNHLSKKRILNVLGSGFIQEPLSIREFFMFKTNIYVLRGELSKNRCERALDSKLTDVALGDPGLLVRRMFSEVELSGEYDVGIICHVVDKDSELIKNIQLVDKKVLFINIEQEPSEFVRQVAQCKFILSSAMHGLICADSLGIPNKHIILSDKVRGGEYKFKDYYSVFKNFTYKPVYLKNNVIVDKDIKTYTNEYNIDRSEVEVICDNIEASFQKYKRDLLHV